MTVSMIFSIKDFLSKCDQIRNLLKKSLMENFIFCAVYYLYAINTVITSTLNEIRPTWADF